MGRTFLGLALLIIAGSSGILTGCGGCYDDADTVRVEPASDCLALFGGQSETDSLVCGTPHLQGVNNCSEALTLPPFNASDVPHVIAPGEKVVYHYFSDPFPPNVTTVNHGSNARDYIVLAKLGEKDIKITVPVHDE